MNFDKRYSARVKLLLLAVVLIFSLGCKKFLDEKPDKKISTPNKLSDLDGILNYYSLMNGKYPQLGEIGSDDYYLRDADWSTVSEVHRNFYLWQKYDVTTIDWLSYETIFATNVVLENAEKIEASPLEENFRNIIKGGALFSRAYYYLALSQLFAPPFEESTADRKLGLPLRLNSDYNEVSVRSTIRETYERILKDLKTAVYLLPDRPTAKYRASKASAYGALSRTYLYMCRYREAGLYADSCLSLYSSLIDYNTITPSAASPFKQFNDEVIFDSRTSVPSGLAQTKARIDPLLQQSYHNNDLRRTIFFKSNTDGTVAFKGNYTGLSSAVMFTGIATDEMLLNRAECMARQGKVTLALQDLNLLLSKRYKTGTFMPVQSSDQEVVLSLILTERRKELLFRTIRWSDLRRLNLEPRYAKDLKRTLNGVSYELKANGLRYTLPIEGNSIILSGMEQNP